MSAQELAAYSANTASPSTSAAAMVKACQDTINKPGDYTTRGGADGDYWPGAAVHCAFAYLTTKQSKYLDQALKYWRASLDDNLTLGDHAGCVAGASTDWKAWAQNQNGSPPPILATVAHDTGYPMRWYVPDLALTYDWLYGAPGVDAGLLAQTRVCLTNWSDWSLQYGYHQGEPGSNYSAGFTIAEALSIRRRSRMDPSWVRPSCAAGSRATSSPRVQRTAPRARR